jgi:hypothetical protein
MSPNIFVLNIVCEVVAYLTLIPATYLAIRRGLFKNLVFLTIYIYALIPRGLILDWFSYGPPLKTPYAPYIIAYFYWSTALLLSFLRILAIAEVGKRILSQSPAVWGLAWRILAFAGVCLLIWTGLGVLHNRYVMRDYIMTLEQRLNILAAFVTLAIMGFGAYYRLLVNPLYRRILVASCIYSAIQLVDTELGRFTSSPSNSVSDFTQRFAFSFMIAMWAWALWKWSGEQPRSQTLISQGQYDDLSPQVHGRLRELNDRLSGIKKK